MMYLSLFFMIFSAFISRNIQSSENENHTFEKGSIEQVIKDILEHKWSVMDYNRHEYIISKEDKDTNTSYDFLSHKGNCSYPIHRCK